MSGGAYSALSGMLTRIGELDRLASDLANVGTAGYKTERAARVAAAHLDSLRSGLENSQAANSPARVSEIRGRTMCAAINSSPG